MIARGDPEAYLHFIQYIMPEFYEQLARDAMMLQQYDDSIRTIVGTLNGMQESNAADVLVDLRTTDIVLLTSVLNAMGTTRRGEVFNQMDASVAAAMLRLISVSEPTLPPLAPALFTPLPHEPEEPADNSENNGYPDNGGE
jgi:hypothetical protein